MSESYTNPKTMALRAVEDAAAYDAAVRSLDREIISTSAIQLSPEKLAQRNTLLTVAKSVISSLRDNAMDDASSLWAQYKRDSATPQT